MDDDKTPAVGPVPHLDPKHVALGFALEIHRPDGARYNDVDADTVLATADRIVQWLTAPGAVAGWDTTPLWALHLQRMVQQVLNKQGAEMADLATIQNTVQELVAEDGVIIAALDDLKAKVDAGGTVTAADLDGLNSTIQGELTKLQDAATRDDPNPAPGPVPTPNPAPAGP